MYKTKAVVTVLVFAALAIFVVVTVWPVIKGNDDGYQTKTSGVTLSKPESEEVTEKSIEAVIEKTEIDVEVVSEEVEVVEEAIESVIEENTPQAETGVIHIVTAQGLKFEPLVTVIAAGDTVAWENMSSHDTQAFADLIPQGTEVWHSSMGENYQRTFTQEGIYIYKCTPHIGAGMGGVVIVGNPVNLDSIKAATVKGAAKRLVKKAIKAAEAL